MKEGFTLIEIFVSITILIGIGAGMLFLFNNQVLGTLQTNAESVAARISSAQNMAISGVNGSAWGVHFSNVTSTPAFYGLFEGTSYSTTTERFYLSNAVEFQSPESGTSTTISFARLTGRISATSTIIIRLKTNTSETKTITVSPLGEITVSQ